MGLYIVKKITEEVKGRIIVTSKLNEGTEFKLIFNKYELTGNDIIKNDLRISIPFYNKNTLYQIKEREYDKNKKTLLIVEDNIELLFYLYKSLNNDFNVFTANNGKEAFEKIKKIPLPDLIISDIMMDELNGYEFYNLLSEEPKFNSVGFIFITAKKSYEEKISALKLGAIDYVTKPFLVEELSTKINSILKYRKNQFKKPG